MRRWLLVGVVIVSLVILAAHLVFTAILYRVVAISVVPVNLPVGITEQFETDLTDLLREAFPPTQPAGGGPPDPNGPARTAATGPTSQPARDTDAMSKGILQALRDRVSDANSLAESKWRHVGPEEFMELREKIESNEPNVRIILEYKVPGRPLPPTSVSSPLRIKRTVRRPIWLTIYLVAGCVLISLAAATASIVILKRSVPRVAR